MFEPLILDFDNKGIAKITDTFNYLVDENEVVQMCNPKYKHSNCAGFNIDIANEHYNQLAQHFFEVLKKQGLFKEPLSVKELETLGILSPEEIKLISAHRAKIALHEATYSQIQRLNNGLGLSNNFYLGGKE